MRQNDVPSGNCRRSRSGLTGAGGSRSRARGQIRRTYTIALNGYAAQLSGARAERLAADPAVASVEQDQRVHSTATQTDAPWGLDRIDQPDLPLNGTYTYPDSGGGNSTVFVLDTGVRVTHQDIAGRASHGWDFVDNDATAQVGNGHGTHVATTAAGTTYGVAKKAKIVAARVLDNNGSGTTAGVIAGVDWITANRTAPPSPTSRSAAAPAPPWTTRYAGRSRPGGPPRTPPPTPATAPPSRRRTSPVRPPST